MDLLSALVSRISTRFSQRLGSALNPATTDQGRTSAIVERWRWPALVAVLVLVALHQLFLSVVITRLAPNWRLPLEVAVNSITGLIVVWIGLTSLARPCSP